MSDVPKIYPALAAIMSDIKAIGKSQKNAQQGFMFRGIDAVMNELHSVFAKHGVIIAPELVDYTVSEKVTGKGAILYYTRARMKFHFVSADDGSEVVVTNVGEAMDSGDKSMNKAMSIALKYALMQMLLIPTQEDKDPDRITHPPTRNMTVAEMAFQTAEGELKTLLVELASAKRLEDVKELFAQNVQYQTEEYRKYFTMRKNELARC